MLVKNARNRDNALKFIDYFGGKRNQVFLFDALRYASANKAATDAVLERGGEGEKFALAVRANEPQLCLELAQARQPDDSEAWTLAWDRIQAA